MKKYFLIWIILTKNSFQAILATKGGMLIFLFGKIFRTILTIIFIGSISSNITKIAGYSILEVLLFFLTFAVLICLGQMIFREVYRFRPKIVSGDFDFDLIKPVHPFIRNIFGGFDLMDLITLPIFLLFLIIALNQITFTSIGLILYVLLLINSLIIMFSIHILVAGLMIINNEVDHAILVYRDVETLGRFPIEFYRQPLQTILTFVIPIAVIFTIPVKTLLGLISIEGVLSAFLVGIVSVVLSVKFWDFAVKKYSSASS